ncbi:hypothetical protein ACHAWF_000540 [Thalassiosira exigua]
MNRAKAAFEAACSDATNGKGGPDFAVGLEGGLERLYNPCTNASDQNLQSAPGELWCMAWMAILGSDSFSCVSAKAEGDAFSPGNKNQSTQAWGYAKTASFLLPSALCELVVNQKMELGHADDKVFKRINSKHGQGTVGMLTDGEIDRADYYIHALKLALIPWMRPEYYFR